MLGSSHSDFDEAAFSEAAERLVEGAVRGERGGSGAVGEALRECEAVEVALLGLELDTCAENVDLEVDQSPFPSAWHEPSIGRYRKEV